MITLRDSIEDSFELNPVANSVANAYGAANANQFQKGWMSAGMGEEINSLYTEAAKAEAAGRMDIAQQYLDQAELRKRSAAAWTPDVNHIENIQGVDDALNFASQGFASGLRSTLPSIAGAMGGVGLARMAAARLAVGGANAGRMAQLAARNPGAAGFAGATIPAYNMEAEEAIGQAMQDESIRSQRSAQEIIDAGRVKGGVNAGLEALVPGLMAGKVAGSGLRKALTPTEALHAAARGIPAAMLQEGLTEGAQGIVGQMTQNNLAGRSVGDIDWMDAANEAAVGSLFGGGMGAVGGVADAGYGLLRKGSDSTVDAVTGIPFKEAAGKAADAIKSGASAVAGAAKGVVQPVVDDYNEGGGGRDGVLYAAAKAEDRLTRGANDLYSAALPAADDAYKAALGAVDSLKNSLSNRISSALGEDADKSSKGLGKNPFGDGSISDEVGLKEVDDNGERSVKLLKSLLSDVGFTNSIDDATLSQLQALNNELVSNKEARRDLKKQAQVQAAYKAAKDNLMTGDTFSNFFQRFTKAQEATGKVLPSKQMTEEGRQRYEDVSSYLKSLGVTDKNIVGRVAGVASTGNAALFQQAVNRELLRDGVISKKDAEILKTLGAPVETEEGGSPTTKSGINRAERRKAQAQRDPFTGSKISEYVASVLSGTKKDTVEIKDAVTNSIHSLVSGLRQDKISVDDVKKYRAAVVAHLGERGGELMDVVADMYEHGSTDAKTKSVANALRSRDGHQSALSGIDKLMTTQHEVGKRASAVHDMLSKLSVAYANGVNGSNDEARAKYLEADKIVAKNVEKLRAEGKWVEARKLLDNMAEIANTDPFAEFNELLEKHFKSKDHGRVERLVSAYIGETRKAMESSAPSKAQVKSRSGTGAVSEVDADEVDDSDAVDPADTDPDSAKLADKDEGEKGYGSNRDEPVRYWGQSARKLGKYNDYPGAPLTRHATFDHPNGELTTLKREIEEKFGGSRIGFSKVVDWAKARAKETGQSETQLLNDAAAAQHEHDVETLAKLEREYSKTDNQLARKDASGSAVRDQISEQMRYTQARIDAYKNLNGDGKAFFNLSSNRHLRYISAEPATGKILVIDEKMFKRYLIQPDGVASAREEAVEKTGVKPEDFTNSLVEVKLANGTNAMLDIAGLVGEMIKRNQEAEIFGAGDKAYEASVLENIRSAFMNVMGSLYVSGMLAAEDPFNAKAGIQAGYSRHGFSMRPGLVVYRESASTSSAPRVYNYGQAFGRKGETAARSSSIKAIDKDLIKHEVESIIPTVSNNHGEKSRDALSKFVARNALIDEKGKVYNLNLNALLKAMMERHGMRSADILPQMDVSDGVSKSLAGALIKDGLELLNKQLGLTLSADMNSPVLTERVLWENEHFDVRFEDVANFVRSDYKGSYDYRSDKLTKAREELQSKIFEYEKRKREWFKTPIDERSTEMELKLAELKSDIEYKIEFNDDLMGQALPEMVKTKSKHTHVAGKKPSLAKTKDGEITPFDVGADTDGVRYNIEESHVSRDAVGRNMARAEYLASKSEQKLDKPSQQEREAKLGQSKQLARDIEAQRLRRDRSARAGVQEVTVTPVNLPGQKPDMTPAPKASMSVEVVETAANQSFRNTRGEGAKTVASIHQQRAAEARKKRSERAEARRLREDSPSQVEEVATSTGKKLSVNEVLDTLSQLFTPGEFGPVIKEMIASGNLPSAMEIARAANKMWGAENTPVAIKRLIKLMEQNPTDPSGGKKFSKQSTDKMSQHGHDKAHADVQRRFGDAVNLLFDDLGGYTGQFDPKEMLMKVAFDPNSIDGAVGHESLHALFELLRKHGGENGQKIIDTILSAASDPRTIAWIEKNLIERGENPNAENGAFSQLNDPEERAAFMLQFYVENDGKLPIKPRARSMFQRVVNFIKTLAGITDDLARTGKFFEYFDSGTFAKNFKNPENIIEGLGLTKREKFVQKLGDATKPVRDLAFAAFGHSADRVRALKNESYTKIVDAIQNGREGYAGFLNEQHARQYQFTNEYTDIMHGVNPAEMDEATKVKLQSFILRMEKYRKESGASGWDLLRKNFPPAFDLDKIEGKLKEFRADLRGYGGLENKDDGELDDIINQIMYDGYCKTNNNLFRDHPEKLTKWASNDINKQAYLYIKQTTKASELARSFEGTSLKELLAAGDSSASPYEREMVRTYVDAALGTSSMTLNPEMRKLFGAVITGLNVSLLPFAVFSQMLEPLQLAFRKNDLSSSIDTAFRGLSDLPRSFKSVDSSTDKDQWEQMARTLGTVTDAASVSMMSDIMNEIPVRGKLDKINQMFFRYNGMEQWSRSMHVAATKNAIEFLIEHGKNPNDNTPRLLKELGVTAADIDINEDGSLNVENPKMRSAVLKFVNESMAHPNAGTNTIWMNDPRFALVAHLKRFTFGFSYYINNRMVSDLRDGRYKSLLPMAFAVPWMIAMDGFKNAVTPADGDYKNDWGVSEYVAQGIDRSGMLGRYGVPADMAKNMMAGGSAIEAISPAAEVTGKIARGIAQDRGLEVFLNKVVPGHQIWD